MSNEFGSMLRQELAAFIMAEACNFRRFFGEIFLGR
jgi:hypothetical protein